jgi:hypothetical protein
MLVTVNDIVHHNRIREAGWKVNREFVRNLQGTEFESRGGTKTISKPSGDETARHMNLETGSSPHLPID